MSNLTQEQVNLLEGFRKRLLPAKLKDTPANGSLLKAWIEANKGGVVTGEAMYEAANACYRAVEWEIKPAKLVMEENELKMRKVVPASASAEQRKAVEKAGIERDTKLKADEQNLKAARACVLSYLPINRQGRVEHGKQAEIQKILNDYLDRQPPNVDTADVLAKVQKYIADKYREAEKAAERV